MAIMTHAKFHFNRLMVTLTFAFGPLSPRAWRTTEKAGPDRVKPFVRYGSWEWKRFKTNVICSPSRNVNFVKHSESLIPHDCASMKLCTQPANMCKIIDFSLLKCPPCMKSGSALNLKILMAVSI